MEFDYDAQSQTVDRSRPRFHYRSVKDEEESRRVGHPVFRDVEYVEIFLPGNITERPCLRVSDVHRKRWPREYEAFKAGEGEKIDGYPVSEWPMATVAVVDTLKAVGILSLEDLAAAADEDLRKIGPTFFNLKQDAIRFLSSNSREKLEIEKLRKENDALKKRLDKLEALVSDAPKKSSRTKRKLTDEQRKRARENLAKARAAKAAKREKLNERSNATGDGAGSGDGASVPAG